MKKTIQGASIAGQEYGRNVLLQAVSYGTKSAL
jgi:hypothetical protein